MPLFLVKKIIKKNAPIRGVFVVLPGFEPRQADPESDVLPLHHRTLFRIVILEL